MRRPSALPGILTILPSMAWSLLALGLAGMLPPPPADEFVAPPIPWQDERLVTPIYSGGPNPCTGKPATLNAAAEVRVAVTAGPDNARVDVEASFDNAVGGVVHDRLTPIVERFAFVGPVETFREQALAHRFQVPVVDGLSGAYLAVTLSALGGSNGQVTVVPTEVRLVCSAAEDEGVRG